MTDWIKIPRGLGLHTRTVFVILASQLLLRVYQVTDNYYLGKLGVNALLIHNILQNLVVVGQFLGIGVSLCSLIFWKRPESQGKQGTLFLVHLGLGFSISAFFALIFVASTSQLLRVFSVPRELWELGAFYFKVGALNMCLYTCYLTLDGLLIALHLQRVSCLLAAFLALGNVVLDYAAVNWVSQNHLQFFVVSSTFLIVTILTAACAIVFRRVTGWGKIQVSSLFPVWTGELTSALIRSSSILILGYQMSCFQVSVGFIVTYHLLSHLSYLATLPLGAGMQLALRDATAQPHREHDGPPRWWNLLLYSSVLPTGLAYITLLIFSEQLLQVFYGYSVPPDHASFLRLFLGAGLMTQVSRIPSVVLRSRKKSQVITRSFILSEWVFTLGGTQLLIWAHRSSSESFGWVLLVSATFLAGILLYQMAPAGLESTTHVH